jgi:hypothetical protein
MGTRPFLCSCINSRAGPADGNRCGEPRIGQADESRPHFSETLLPVTMTSELKQLGPMAKSIGASSS